MAKAFTSYHIEERSFVSYIKREIHGEVVKGAFSEQGVGEIDIIVSEICSNIVKHAGQGELLYRVSHETATDSTFELVAIDKGPGMVDTVRMMKDGVSTSSTLGHGLGALERLSDFFQIYSIPEWGTVLYSKVTTQKSSLAKKELFDLDIRALCVPKPRETACGDGYRIKRTADEIKIFFGDGLGHGPHAEEAVVCAGDAFFNSDLSDPPEIIRHMHESVRRTRGLVGVVAVLNRKTNEWNMCGVGNILSRLYHGIEYRNYMSYNGTIGLNIPTTMKPSTFRAERNQQLMLTSDGLRSRWDLMKFPSIMKFDSMILAASVYKDFTRGNDDSSILIAKVN